MKGSSRSIRGGS